MHRATGTQQGATASRDGLSAISFPANLGNTPVEMMETLAAQGHLYAYRHEAFWQCMDTVRDLRYLEAEWESGTAPWKTW